MPIVLLLLAVLSSGCFASREGAVVFPTQSETGLVTMTDGKAGATGVRTSTALSWASVSPNPKTPLDISIGYQVDHFGTTDKPLKHGSVPIPVVFHGPFLEVSHRVGGSEHTRQWLGARVEMPMRNLGADNYVGLGAMLRASIEWFTAGTTNCSIGAVGVGGYVESGLRKIPGGENAFVMSSGLSLRLPFVAVD